MLYDISQTLRRDLPVWPGDTAFTCKPVWVMSSDVPVNVSSLTLSTHSGSHTDAPFHYDANGKTIDAVDPNIYLGLAQIVDARHAKKIVTTQDILSQLVAGISRILIRTYEKAPQQHWDSNFIAIEPSLIEALADRQIKLIGVDTPSLDPQTSKTMDAHLAVARRGLAIIEGLVLDAVPFGIYELIALPLKIAGADSSPVRAILRSI